MDPNIVLRKTGKGATELKTREYKLSPALRMVLILVDGRTDIAGLHRKAIALKEMDEYIGTLLKEGFISTGSEDEITAIDDTHIGAIRAKWEIVEMVSEVLGEEFADRATKRFMVVPDTAYDLKQALNECCQFIALTIDESKARTVGDKGADILSRIDE